MTPARYQLAVIILVALIAASSFSQVCAVNCRSLSIPAELAARAAFLAKMHRDKNVEDWVTKVIKERVELEQVAFNKAKREMSLRNGI